MRPTNSPRRTKTGRTKTRRPLFEPLECRRMMAVKISEVHVSPLFGDENVDQYVELRGAPGGSIDAGTYLVVVDGDRFAEGEIHTVFDLSGQTFGSNGYLVLLEQGNGYRVSSQARVLTSTSAGFGGLPGGIFHDDSSLTDKIDFIAFSNSFLLVKAASPPSVEDDIDADGDGVPEGTYGSWEILDSVATLWDGSSSSSYAATTFTTTTPRHVLPDSTVVLLPDAPGYMARIGESVGSAATDWVAGTTTERENASWRFRLERGIFGTPEPQVYSGRDLDHLGAPNFFSAIRGTVFDDPDGDGLQDGNDPGRAGVTVWTDHDGNPATNEYVVRIEPDDYPLQSDLTNVAPNATLTTADTGNVIESFFVRPQTKALDIVSTGEMVFAHEGVNFTPSTRKIRIDFYDPVRSVSIDAVGGLNGGSYGRLEAFNRSGQSLGFIRSAELSQGQVEQLTITHGSRDIAYAVAWSDSDYVNSSPFGVFDNLSFIQHEYSTVTDQNGDYGFELLPAGTYQLHVQDAEGRIATTSTTRTVVLDGYETVNNVDFGSKGNSAPDVHNQEFRIDENSSNGTPVGFVTATDRDPGQTLSFAITGGTGQGLFSVHPSTGRITVSNSAALNFETTPVLTLAVQVKDDYGDPGVSSATMTIRLNDVNEAPVLQAASFVVAENVDSGTLLGVVTATDVEGHGIRYSLVGGTAEGPVAIDEISGQITVNRSEPFDRELRSFLDVTVRATDDGIPARSSTRAYRVEILNVNEAPSIPDQSFQIPEHAAAGTLVGTLAVLDPDVGDTYQLSLVGGSGRDAFLLDRSTGEIRVADPALIDFETTGSLTLQIHVADGGHPALTANGTATISLTDRNDPPSLAPQVFAVAENSDSGTVVGTVFASDVDVGQHLSFRITGGTGQARFAVHPTTGVITVVAGSNLDFEQSASFTLGVEVSDSAVPSATRSATMTISLTDANDPPSLAEQRFSVAENAAPNTAVGTVHGQDGDQGDALSYRIVGGTGEMLFAIDRNTGALTTVADAGLDREAREAFTVLVEVTDRAGAAAQATVTVDLLDVNEFDPLLAEQVFRTPENTALGALVGKVIASDADHGQTVTYEITEGNTRHAFSLDPVTGELRVENPSALDYEANPRFALTIRVTDNVSPQRNTSATITVQLDDVNEFEPLLANTTLSVSENAPGQTVVGTVTAIDHDSSQQLRYTITGGNTANVFEIDPLTGTIRVAAGGQLDFEATRTYQLAVTATDDGQPTRSKTATVTVNLTNVNEYAPTITAQEFSIHEGAANGTLIGFVVAEDQDAAQTMIYTLVDGNTQNAVILDPATGAIRVANPGALDYEQISDLTLTISVSDSGTPAKTGEGTVKIHLADVNEWAPQLPVATWSVAEGIAAGTAFGTLVATDLDSHQTLTYSIVAGNVGNAFVIDPNTGELTVRTAGAVNFESTPKYDLTIQVTDNGEPPQSESLTYVVQVLDVNEFEPVIGNLQVTLAENAPARTVAGNVLATDGDSQQRIRYSISAGNTGEAWSIDEATGAITVRDPAVLDFETTPAYTLTVVAADNGSPSRVAQATVAIALRDVNESDPTVPETTLHIAENSPPGTLAGAVKVVDGDTAETHTFTLIGGNPGNLFQLNGTTGNVTLAPGKSLDRETTASVPLTILVVDSGAPRRSSTVVIQVAIDNVNEPPSAVATGPFTMQLGESLTVDATGSADIDDGDLLTFAWDLNGDSVADFTTTEAIARVPWQTLAGLDLRVGTHAVNLTVRDRAGASATATASLTIGDVFRFEAPASGTAQEIHLGLSNGQRTVGGADGAENAVVPEEVQRVEIRGAGTDDTLTVDYASGNPIPPGGITFDGGDGDDMFVIGGANVHLDLTGTPTVRFVNIETIHIIGHSPNTLTLDVPSVIASTDASHTLQVISDRDDTVNFDAGWRLTRTEVANGQLVRILEQGGATVRLIGPNDWRQPVRPMDVNNSGSIEPQDVLVVINELNSPRYTLASRQLVDAAGLPTFPRLFFDVNNDTFSTAIDALIIINLLNSRTASGEGESGPIQPLVAVSQSPTAPPSSPEVEQLEPLLGAFAFPLRASGSTVPSSERIGRIRRLSASQVDDYFSLEESWSLGLADHQP